MKRRSQFTYAGSQLLTTLEVLIFLGVGTYLWFGEKPYWAIGMLLLAIFSISRHFKRKYKDD